jgi:hypothetical protein
MSSMIEEEEEKSPNGLDVEEELLETVSELKIQSLAAYGYGKAPSEQLLLSSLNWRQGMRPDIPLEFKICAMHVLCCIFLLPGNFIGQALPCTVGPGTWIRGSKARDM